MPTVPTADNFSVLPSSSPGGAIDLGITPDQATTGARQMITEGQQIEQAGGDAAKVQIDALARAGALRVSDSMNQMKEAELNARFDPKTGYENVKGIDALQRPSGLSLADDYGNVLKQKADTIYNSLGSDAQKEAFRQQSDELITNFKGGATQHEGAEFQTYALSVRDGTIKNRQNEIVLNYKDPAAVDSAVTSIQAAVYDQAKLLGKSAEWADAQSREATSKAHALAINTSLQKNDPTFADMYMKKYSKEMNADDILAVNGSLTKQLDGQIGLNAATQTIQEMGPKITTSDSDRAFNIALGTESNHQQLTPTGEPVTSPKGAIGIAQVMPDTAKEVAANNGIEWDDNKYKTDAVYNAKLGKLYFDQQLKSNGGNLAMAYAAYNAGPGNLQKAKDAAIAEGKPENWAVHLPAETQAYVTKNMTAFGSGDGQYTKPTLVDVQNAIRTKIGANQPERLKIALDEGERQYKAIGDATKQRTDEAKASAMRGVMENGGRFTDLPANVRGALAPEDVSGVMDFAKKVSMGDDTTSLYLYQKLSADPAALKSMSDNEFFALRAELSQADFKHFSDQRAGLINGTTENGPGNLNNSAIKSTLDDRLISMGFDPNPKDKTSDDAQQMGAIRQFVNQSVITEQANRGKKMSDAETNSYIDQLFAQQVPSRRIGVDIPLIGGLHWTRSSSPLITQTVGDIPGPTKDALKAAFKRQGIDSPSDGDLLNAYMQQVSMANKAKAKKNG